MKLFADDTFLCAQNEDINLLEEEVNVEINKVYQWLVSNKLTLNVLKSKFMIISNKKRLNNEFTVCIKDCQMLGFVRRTTKDINNVTVRMYLYFLNFGSQALDQDNGYGHEFS